jgi:hypothetical protein
MRGGGDGLRHPDMVYALVSSEPGPTPFITCATNSRPWHGGGGGRGPGQCKNLMLRLTL